MHRGERSPDQHTLASQTMAFTFLMPWQQSFQGSHANDTVLTFSSNQEIDLGEGDNFLLSFGHNTEAQSGNGDDTSTSLFKKSAALAGQERDLFVESLQRTGVFTALPSTPGIRAPVATASASLPNDQACCDVHTPSPACSPRAHAAVGPTKQHDVCDLVGCFRPFHLRASCPRFLASLCRRTEVFPVN